MNLNKILVLLLCVFILLVITGCTYSVQPDSKENKQIGGCNNHYFTKFGIGVGDITVESIECEWTPNDRYG